MQDLLFKLNLVNTQLSHFVWGHQRYGLRRQEWAPTLLPNVGHAWQDHPTTLYICLKKILEIALLDLLTSICFCKSWTEPKSRKPERPFPGRSRRILPKTVQNLWRVAVHNPSGQNSQCPTEHIQSISIQSRIVFMVEYQVCLDDVLVWNLIHRQQVPTILNQTSSEAP